MGAEAGMRGRVVESLRKLHAVAIENSCDKGTPDVNTLAGWIELKQIDGWPVREDTPVRVPKFTDEQRIWLRNRCLAGGSAYLLIRVGAGHGAEWLLLWGAWAADNLGKLKKVALQEGAVARWPSGLVSDELARALLQRGTKC